jgi:glucosamine--fructose-6-phosphate aminotransferase (isomerizing)
MCGIAGFHKSNTEIGRWNSRQLSASLLNQIVSRGRDATGVAWVQKGADNKREVWYSKQASAAPSFIKAGGLEPMPTKCKTAILHTRYATQGCKTNIDNNHPIIVGGIVGIHNGHISNDKELIANGNFQRVAQVDSEAAFWQISAHSDPREGLKELRGTAALAWMEVDNPNCLHLARCAGSPLNLAQTEGGTVIFASTKPLLTQALTESKIGKADLFDIPEWTYLKVFNGKIVEWLDIPKPALTYYTNTWYASPELPWSATKQGKKDLEKMEAFGWKS